MELFSPELGADFFVEWVACFVELELLVAMELAKMVVTEGLVEVLLVELEGAKNRKFL